MTATLAPVRTNRYAAVCARCQQTVPAETGALTRESGRWTVRHTDACEPRAARPARPVETMPDAGYYAVEWDGALRFYAVREGKGKWDGRRFLNRFRSDYMDRPSARERGEADARGERATDVYAALAALCQRDRVTHVTSRRLVRPMPKPVG